MSRYSSFAHTPDFKEVSRLSEEWALYKDLIAGVPDDIGIVDIAIGNHWVYVEAESGCGMALTVSGGRGSFSLGSDLVHMTLKDLACQCISWNFLEASVGVAALNAWYSTPDNARAVGMRVEDKATNDGFGLYRELCLNKKVSVIGHFPLIERLQDECELTVLERNPHGKDIPDSGCEYLLPHQDFTFVTGVTLTNKTLPRLLQLSQGGSTILVGPSVVPAPQLYKYGVDCMAGSVIDDPARAKQAIMQGASSEVFEQGVQKMRVERPGWIQGLL